MRRKVNAELDAELQAINEAALKSAEFRLKLEKAMQETSGFRRFRRLLQTGVGSHNARNLVYALALPLARSPILKEKAGNLLDRLRRKR
jgi:hypothetical protein